MPIIPPTNISAVQFPFPSPFPTPIKNKIWKNGLPYTMAFPVLKYRDRVLNELCCAIYCLGDKRLEILTNEFSWEFKSFMFDPRYDNLIRLDMVDKSFVGICMDTASKELMCIYMFMDSPYGGPHDPRPRYTSIEQVTYNQLLEIIDTVKRWYEYIYPPSYNKREYIYI